MYDRILCNCGREIGSLYPLYYKLMEDIGDGAKVFELLKLDYRKSACCRVNLMSNARMSEYYG